MPASAVDRRPACARARRLLGSCEVLTYASFGGALQKAEEAGWLRPFEKEHPGVTIVYDFVDYAKLKAEPRWSR
jgi:hypothetical protein